MCWRDRIQVNYKDLQWEFKSSNILSDTDRTPVRLADLPANLFLFFYFFCRSIHTAPGCCSQLPSFLSHLLFFFFFILLLSLSLSLCLISFFLLDSSLFSSGFIFFYLFFNPFPSLSFSVPSIKPLHATHLDLSPPTFFLNGNPKLYTLSPPH